MMMDTKQNSFLKRARLERQWTQQEVSEKLNVRPITVGRWERGEAMPTRHKRKMLSKVFGLTPQELGFTSNASLPVSHPTRCFLSDPMIPPPPGSLVGRDRLLETIQQCLVGGSAVVALHGLPGVGKTTLALSLVSRLDVQERFQEGILWAGLGPTPNIPEILSRWGALLGIAASGIGASKSSDVWISILREVIGTRRMLIVLDDVWNGNDISSLNVGGPQCVYLATMRSPQIAVLFANQAISIPELDEQHGVVLLEQLAPEIKLHDYAQIRSLVRSVGALPLALILVGKYLHAQGHFGQQRRIQSAIKRLEDANHRLQLSEPIALAGTHPGLPLGSSVSLQSVVAVSDHYLDEESRHALHALSVFPAKPNTFSEEAALAVSGSSEDTLDTLSDAGLLEVDDAGRYTLHQAIADYARASLTDQAPYQRLAAYYRAYCEKKQEDIEGLDLESQNIGAALEAAYARKRGEDLVRGVCAFAHFLLVRGLYDQAEYYLHLAREGVQGDARMEEAVLLPLGQAAQKQGAFAQAAEFFQRGLAIARQCESAERISAFLADLGWVTWKQGRYHLAEEYLNEGLVLAHQIKNDERICTILRVLGAVHSSLGKFPQARQYLQEGLLLASQITHREHICVLLIDLGVTLFEVNDMVRGRELLQEGLALAQELGHREWTSLAFINLADEALQSKRYVEATNYTHKGLHIARQIGNREWICCHLINLGILSREQGALPNAEVIFKEALDLIRVSVDRPFVHFMGVYEYGLLCLKQNQVEVAETLFREASSIMPEGDRNLAGLLLFARAQVKAKQGNWEQAFALAQESKATFIAIGSDQTRIVEQWMTVSFDTS